jgi:hypothetical protein
MMLMAPDGGARFSKMLCGVGQDKENVMYEEDHISTPIRIVGALIAAAVLATLIMLLTSCQMPLRS